MSGVSGSDWDCCDDGIAAQAATVELAGEAMYQTYMKYLTGCADLFRSGETNLYQFKMRVA